MGSRLISGSLSVVEVVTSAEVFWVFGMVFCWNAVIK